MRKLMMLMALLAVASLAAVPVLAQPVQEFELEEADSGDVEPEFAVENSGNSSNICVGGVQQSNSGNVQNIQGVNQDRVVESDDLEFEGRPYRSLSAIARYITGTRWNGWTFFGLRHGSAA